jgi:hypothetical protein
VVWNVRKIFSDFVNWCWWEGKNFGHGWTRIHTDKNETGVGFRASWTVGGSNIPARNVVPQGQMRYRLKRHQYVALALLLLEVVVYFWIRPEAVDMRRWKPLAVPIQLRIGEIRTCDFTTDLNSKYRLLIESDRRIEFKRHECLLGMVDWDRAKTCAGIPELVDLERSVLDHGRVITSGSSRNSWGGFYSDTIARELGEFTAQKNQQYSIVLSIRRDGGELNKTNPTLLVETQPWEWKEAVVGSALISQLRILGTALFVAAGLLTLVLSPRFRISPSAIKRAREVR